MRYVALICFCLFIGFVLGRWGPSDDLRRARAELKQLREGGSPDARSGQSVAVAARGFLQIDEAAVTPAAPGETDSPTGDEDAPPAVPATNVTAGTASREERPPASMEEELNKAKELWRTRSELARNSFLENTEADQQQAIRFDVLIEGMNIRLKNHIDQWAVEMEGREAIRAEDGARLIHALSGDVVLTYDEFDRSFPEGWREDAGMEFKIFDFIDPSVADSLTGIEEKLDAFDP